MASPSRSGSVASSSSSTLLSASRELGDLALLLRRHDVERLELVVDVHAEAGPRLALVLGRDVRGPAREVADVADRRLDDVVAAEVGRDLLGLGRRLDDHETARRAAGGGGRGRGGTPAAARLARRRCRLGVGLRARSGRHVVTHSIVRRVRHFCVVPAAASIHGRGRSSRRARHVFCLSHTARRRSDGRERSRVVNRACHPRLRPLVRRNTREGTDRPAPRGVRIRRAPVIRNAAAATAARRGNAGASGCRDQRQVGLRGVRVEQQIDPATVPATRRDHPHAQHGPVELHSRRHGLDRPGRPGLGEADEVAPERGAHGGRAALGDGPLGVDADRGAGGDDGTGARQGSASTTDSRAVSPEPKRTIWPGPHSRPARSPGRGGRAPAEKSDSCDTGDTGRTVEHAFEDRTARRSAGRAAALRRELLAVRRLRRGLLQPR